MTDDKIIAVVLAGGSARRMGSRLAAESPAANQPAIGSKALLPLAGKSLLAHIIERISGQVSEIILNINGDLSAFQDFGLEIVADVVDGQAGPLAGVLTGMEWVRAYRPGVDWILTVPGDAPFLPTDLVQRFAQAVATEDAQMACASSGGRSHPVVGLWPTALGDELRVALVDRDVRKIDRWTAEYRVATVEWPTQPVDPFFNINRPRDLVEAERLIGNIPV